GIIASLYHGTESRNENPLLGPFHDNVLLTLIIGPTPLRGENVDPLVAGLPHGPTELEQVAWHAQPSSNGNVRFIIAKMRLNVNRRRDTKTDRIIVSRASIGRGRLP